MAKVNKLLDDLDLERMTAADAIWHIDRLSSNVLPQMSPMCYEHRLDAINLLARVVIARVLTGRCGGVLRDMV